MMAQSWWRSQHYRRYRTRTTRHCTRYCWTLLLALTFFAPRPSLLALRPSQSMVEAVPQAHDLLHSVDLIVRKHALEVQIIQPYVYSLHTTLRISVTYNLTLSVTYNLTYIRVPPELRLCGWSLLRHSLRILGDESTASACA
jgi:hypothetical protein